MVLGIAGRGGRSPLCRRLDQIHRRRRPYTRLDEDESQAMIDLLSPHHHSSSAVQPASRIVVVIVAADKYDCIGAVNGPRNVSHPINLQHLCQTTSTILVLTSLALHTYCLVAQEGKIPETGAHVCFDTTNFDPICSPASVALPRDWRP
jgi:hypothetical protein